MKKALLAVLCLCSSSIANAGSTIDFESYSDPTIATSFTDSGATFTGYSNGPGDPIGFYGFEHFTISSFGISDWGTAAPQILCPQDLSFQCAGAFDVTFAAPVDELQFYFTGDDFTTNTSGDPIGLTVQVFLGATLLGAIQVAGDGDPTTAQLVDLTSFGSVDKIRVSPPVTGGLPDGYGYDDFSWNLLSTAVPEPQSWLLLLLGFGFMGVAIRRADKNNSPILKNTAAAGRCLVTDC